MLTNCILVASLGNNLSNTSVNCCKKAIPNPILVRNVAFLCSHRSAEIHSMLQSVAEAERRDSFVQSLPRVVFADDSGDNDVPTPWSVVKRIESSSALLDYGALNSTTSLRKLRGVRVLVRQYQQRAGQKPIFHYDTCMLSRAAAWNRIDTNVKRNVGWCALVACH